MLVENLVRDTLKIKDHRVVIIEGDVGHLDVYLERKKRRHLICSKCHQPAPVRDRRPERMWLHVPLWGIKMHLHYRPTRVMCESCGLQMEDLPWSMGKSPLTKQLIATLAIWARYLAWDLLGRIFGFAWGTIRAAVKKAVDYGLVERDTSDVVYIGIDEISIKKGHHYLTNIYDLASMRLIWSGEGRKEETLQRFYQEWGSERTARLGGICMDMWKPYNKVAQNKCPEATIVFDKFHVVKHLHNAVDEVRKEEARELQKTNPQLLKGSKYVFLKNPWNLTPKQTARLGYLSKLNLKINRAYLLKEEFRKLWDYRDPCSAAAYLNQWIWWATHSRLKPLVKFAQLLRDHKDGILAWFKVPIDNGATEAMNNNCKQISHRAHGFRKPETFIYNMYHCLGQLPLPQTTHRFV